MNSGGWRQVSQFLQLHNKFGTSLSYREMGRCEINNTVCVCVLREREGERERERERERESLLLRHLDVTLITSLLSSPWALWRSECE